MNVSRAPALAGRQPSIGAATTVLGALAQWSHATPDAQAICLYGPSGESRQEWTYRQLALATSAAAKALRQHVGSYSIP